LSKTDNQEQPTMKKEHGGNITFDQTLDRDSWCSVIAACSKDGSNYEEAVKVHEFID